MTKQKISIAYRLSHLFTYHPWLKLIALALAAMVWFYVNGEMRHYGY